MEALVFNYFQQNLVLESLAVDDVKLELITGLDIIPVDILKQGTKKIVQYMMDLFRSPNADPLYRYKLMVVGFAEIGKSTLIDCLFPLRGELFLVEVNGCAWNPYYFELQGNLLKRYPKGMSLSGSASSAPLETVSINKEWTVDEKKEFEQEGVVLAGPAGETREIYAETGSSMKKWIDRFRDIKARGRTHGIDIQDLTLEDENTREYFQGKGRGKLELSVWDFAGQHDYYNNHHHFLSARSLFLVMWNVRDHYISDAEGRLRDDGPSTVRQQRQGKELASLRFWFFSLAFHLPRKITEESDRNYYSIVVVGTHFDQLTVYQQSPEQCEIRKREVEKIAAEYGLQVSSFVEVSCVNELTNIAHLQATISREMLQLKCMGERIPKSYLDIGHLVQANRLEHMRYPVVGMDLFTNKFWNEKIVRNALTLLSMWGMCVLC